MRLNYKHCVHEAGHAVVALALGGQLERIEVTANNGGHVALADSNWSEQSEAMFYFAGCAAVQHAGFDQPLRGGTGDLDKIADLMGCKSIKDLAALDEFSEINSQTINLIQRYQAGVVSIADYLSIHGYADHTTARSLLWVSDADANHVRCLIARADKSNVARFHKLIMLSKSSVAFTFMDEPKQQVFIGLLNDVITHGNGFCAFTKYDDSYCMNEIQSWFSPSHQSAIIAQKLKDSHV